MNEPQDSIRELSKWLNEHPNRPVDQQALARVLHYIDELERRKAHLANALNRIVTEDVGTAKCVSIAYKALSATSADTKAWLHAEIVKRMGDPVAWIGKAEDGVGSYFSYKHPATGSIIKIGAYVAGIPLQEINLYAFPSPDAILPKE